VGIFDKRTSFKPFEDPDVIKYKDAINHSYWLVTEWNFTSDIQDFHTKLTSSEQRTIKNALLAISQIEISVKRFWTKLGDRFPKAEYEQVGVTFGESEVRHADAYSHLLEVLGLNDEFTMLLENPVIQARVEYLTKYLKGASDTTDESYTLTLALFALFVENVSLFSQFAIIKSFNKYRNLLKDVDNVVQATAKEECHAEGTEILTSKGWKNFADVNVGEEVVAYNNGSLVKENITFKTDKEYIGPMYHYKSSQAECLVTPGHDMLYFNPAGEMFKKAASNFIPHSKSLIPYGGTPTNIQSDSLTWFERLLVATQADGSALYWDNTKGERLYRGKNDGVNYSIRLTKERKKERLGLILANTNIKYSIKPLEGNEIEYKICLPYGPDFKQFDWVKLENRSPSWCEDFIKETVQWDGFFTESIGRLAYSSTNKKAIDIVQAAAIMAGYRTNIGRKHDSRNSAYKETYKLYFRKRNLLVAGHAIRRELIEQYSGRVRCVTVPSGAIITRYNDKTFIAGNCIHALLGAYLINKIKKEHPDWFDEDFYAKIARAAKKAYDAELNIISWIFEDGDLDFITRDLLDEFIKDRFNKSLILIGAEAQFSVDTEKLAELSWFDEEILTTVAVDFFNKKSTAYSKGLQSFSEGDLF
jgi:ribonucleotide reductase beta subunit family protein with ferritin-like domain